MTAHSGRDPRSGGLESEVTSLTPLIVSRFIPAVLNSKPPKQIAPVFCLVKAGPLHRMCQMPRVWQMFEKYIQKYFFWRKHHKCSRLIKVKIMSLCFKLAVIITIFWEWKKDFWIFYNKLPISFSSPQLKPECQCSLQRSDHNVTQLPKKEVKVHLQHLNYFVLFYVF